jgi:hypothetical protein
MADRLVILPSTQDGVLQPDAMRGSEQYLKVKGTDDIDVEVIDMEQDRRDSLKQAHEESTQYRITSPAVIGAEPQRKSGEPVQSSKQQVVSAHNDDDFDTVERTDRPVSFRPEGSSQPYRSSSDVERHEQSRHSTERPSEPVRPRHFDSDKGVWVYDDNGQQVPSEELNRN